MRFLAALLFFSLLGSPGTLFGASAAEADIEEQTRAIAAELRCVVCQNLSVADSPSDMAQQMRAIVREQVAAGKSPQEIKDYFVSKYGEWVLLAPMKKGFSLLVWVVPFIALAGGLAFGAIVLRRWTRQKDRSGPAPVDPAVLQRVRAEAATDQELRVDLEDTGRQSQLLQERARLYTDLKELDFDYEAGKLSQSDYAALRDEIERKAAAVVQQLDRESQSASGPKRPQPAASPGSDQRRPGIKGWQLGLGAAFLLIFGLTLGLMLSQSLRPRTSSEDSITGDFLTGTSSAAGAASGSVPALLQEAGTAISKDEWAKAIQAVKNVLAMDPDNPEAHAYMGYILFHANHADGALMAFEKALSISPNLPLALWGKGMTLYQSKQDNAGAREVFQKLLKVVPAGPERAEVEKILAEIPRAGEPSSRQPKAAEQRHAGSATRITGKITVDPKLKARVDAEAVLFIIARGGSGGPPVAVKKVERPAFPLSYALGPENVMMQGAALSGQLMLSARLDKDGNPMTREAGSLTGEHKTAVTAGSQNVDFVMDQVAR